MMCFRVIAVDMRGHGGSSHSSSGDYNPSAMAKDIESMILELDLYVKPVRVVGTGLGAAVAVALAQQTPWLVGALVLMEFCLAPGIRAHLEGMDLLTFHPAQAMRVAGMFIGFFLTYSVL